MQGTGGSTGEREKDGGNVWKREGEAQADVAKLCLVPDLSVSRPLKS